MKNRFSTKSVGLLLCFILAITDTQAQTEIITFPVVGSVFQKDQNNNLSFYLAGQLKNTSSMRYLIQRKNGSNWDNIQTDKSLPLTWTVGDRRGFYINAGNLSTGWYRVRLYKLKTFLGIPNRKDIRDTKEFGVGNVYFVAGQSNAQAYLGGDGDDNPNPVLNFTQNPYARVYKIRDNTPDKISNGLPYNKPNANIPSKFDIFDNGKFTDYNKYGVYPNGLASWCWSSLAKKIADEGTPVIFFNNGVGGSSVNQDWGINSNNLNKFKKTLQMYGNVLGAKAVLWHQGERDSQILSLSSTNQSTYLDNYATGLSNIISQSRNVLKDETSKNLSWYISKVSYTTGTNENVGFGIGSQRTTPIFTFDSNCVPNNGIQRKKQ